MTSHSNSLARQVHLTTDAGHLLAVLEFDELVLILTSAAKTLLDMPEQHELRKRTIEIIRDLLAAQVVISNLIAPSASPPD